MRSLPVSKSPVRVVIIGAGKGGRALIELFCADPSVEIAGVVDINPEAPGIKLARKLNLPISTDFRHCLTGSPQIDLIMDVTGNSMVHHQLEQLKPAHCELMGGASARFLWALLEEKHQRKLFQQKYLQMVRQQEHQLHDDFIVGDNPKMKEVAHLIKKVAPTPTTVLIIGETGTGKEVIARTIHRQSHLKDRPLITVNCTAFSPNLIESELFGYKKGAFTGASHNRIGIMEEAHQGTVFLDEIGDMPLEMQAKLLRFLQSGEIRPVGDTTIKKVKVRVIAATNRDLESVIQQGEFRADLFYRLNTFVIHLPPLRERKEDIPLMAYHFLRIAEARVNKHVKKITPAALEVLTLYNWPGNLRELENVIERAVILSPGGEIDVRHLSINLHSETETPSFTWNHLNEGISQLKKRMIEKIEKEVLIYCLIRQGGNISRAARMAKVSRRTFQRLMAKHQISSLPFLKKPQELQ